ncbi:hypothetical protein ABW19_dt0205541 [Dactylella cylindrospora]|nr:hypothetical protein ABW19_dt0205541 [Dactylella cylindrospora]
MRSGIRWVCLSAFLVGFVVLWRMPELDYDELDSIIFPSGYDDKGANTLPRIVVSFGDAWSAPPVKGCKASGFLDGVRLSWFHSPETLQPPSTGYQSAPSNATDPAVFRSGLNVDTTHGATAQKPISTLSSSVQSTLWENFQSETLPSSSSNANVNGQNPPSTTCTPIPWTERLCRSYIRCTHFHNYASRDLVGTDHTNPFYRTVFPNFDDSGDSVKDFMTQVEEWVSFARRGRYTAGRGVGQEVLEMGQQGSGDGDGDGGEGPGKWVYDDNTLFTVWFGMGEVLKYSLMEREQAVEGVEAALDVLFVQLVRLNLHSPPA